MIPGLEYIYGPLPWEPQFHAQPLHPDPWGGKHGFVFPASFDGAAETAAAEAIYHVVLAEALHAKARQQSSFCVCETGTSDGYSTAFIARALVASENADGVPLPGRVWTGEVNPLRSHDRPRPWPGFWEDLGLADRIVPCLGDTRVAETWAKGDPPLPEALDVVFLDSEHTTETVMREWELLGPRLRSGGVLLAHDFNLFPEVEGAVRQIADDLSVGITLLHSCRGLALVRKPVARE